MYFFPSADFWNHVLWAPLRWRKFQHVWWHRHQRVWWHRHHTCWNWRHLNPTQPANEQLQGAHSELLCIEVLLQFPLDLSPYLPQLQVVEVRIWDFLRVCRHIQGCDFEIWDPWKFGQLAAASGAAKKHCVIMSQRHATNEVPILPHNQVGKTAGSQAVQRPRPKGLIVIQWAIILEEPGYRNRGRCSKIVPFSLF